MSSGNGYRNRPLDLLIYVVLVTAIITHSRFILNQKSTVFQSVYIEIVLISIYICLLYTSDAADE